MQSDVRPSFTMRNLQGLRGPGSERGAPRARHPCNPAIAADFERFLLVSTAQMITPKSTINMSSALLSMFHQRADNHALPFPLQTFVHTPLHSLV